MSESPDFAPFEARMRAEDLPPLAIETFRRYHAQLVEGHTGLMPESSLTPVDDLPDAERLPAALEAVGRAQLPRTLILKLNGGLGTSMGLERAKSLLEVKEGQTFLDISARQAIAAGTPLVLMNSFNTRDDSLAALEGHPDLPGDLPRDFCQHKVPKVLRDTLEPARWPQDPALTWCPPGHGDLYTALVTSGALEAFRAAGYRYAFVSNIDNLGATLDLRLLGHLVSASLPFLMEVADRTQADRKGGHLARDPHGRLVLRELAQCPDADQGAFQDTSRHRYFNTNSIWLDLDALARRLDALDGVLGLPMIRNAKTLDPRDPSSPPVYQLESAMGAAIAVFEGAGAARVPRSRFLPVKTCNDLATIRSDRYQLTQDARVVDAAPDAPTPFVDLDPRHYGKIDDFEAHFPTGVPSLRRCSRWIVRGDVRFGADVALEGQVTIENVSGSQALIPDHARLEGGVEIGHGQGGRGSSA